MGTDTNQSAGRPETRRQLYMPDSWEDPLSPDEGAKNGQDVHSTLRRPHALAVAVAEQLGGVMREWCVTLPGDAQPRMRVVGSVRRLKATVKDLEILFISKVLKVKDRESLLGELREASAINVMLDSLVQAGVLAKRLKCDGSVTWGEEIRLAVHVASGLPVDFFAATRENWWNQLVCRTGGKEMNTAICNAAIAKGLKWATTSAGFKCRRTGKVIRTVHSERDVFAAVGMEYREPSKRL